MEELTRSRMEEIKKLITSLDDTEIEKKLSVVQYFWKSKTHVTAQELSSTIESLGDKIDAEFVEYTLDLLSKLGLAQRIEFENEPVRYENRHLGDHHDHMICVECGKIIEFEEPRLERIQDSVADKHGFTLIRHKMEFYGFCNSCSNKRGDEIYLKDARAGEMLEVISLKGGSSLNKKCSSMGITKKAVIEVLNANKGGQLIVACSGSRYILGKGITDKILVKRISEEKCMMAKNHTCPYINETTDSFIKGCRGSSIPMNCLKSGDKGIIIRTGGCKRLRRRLFEMGLLNGAEFEIVKYAPLKDPLELIVRGTHISLRVDEAKHIMVRKS